MGVATIFADLNRIVDILEPPCHASVHRHDRPHAEAARWERERNVSRERERARARGGGRRGPRDSAMRSPSLL